MAQTEARNQFQVSPLSYQLSVSTIWFPLLHKATREQRERYEIGGGGVSLHWPEIERSVSYESNGWHRLAICVNVLIFRDLTLLHPPRMGVLEIGYEADIVSLLVQSGRG